MKKEEIVLSSSVLYALGKADQITRRIAAQMMGSACEITILHTKIGKGNIASVSADPMDRILMATRVTAAKPNDLSRSISFKVDICPADADVQRVSHTIQFALHLRAKMPERIWRVEDISAITAFDYLRSGMEIFVAKPVEPRCLIEHGHASGECAYPTEKFLLARS